MPITKLSATVPAVLALATAAALTGCTVTVQSPAGEPAPAPSSSSSSSSASHVTKKSGDSRDTGDVEVTPVVETKHTAKPATGPRIVSFKVVQKPRCPEGTDVYRTEGAPLIIKWKITGAHSAALSVDDPTGTPGTYGPVGLHGTQEFTFSCAGEPGHKETHTYALYTVGGGKQRHKTLTVSATVRETGIPVT
ncbi:hypothetical protein Asp14428_65130 [Actinoplanes sp. NBRC 14428]|nr:hypothetical protein Asp14428_65130 [Actinoplanes sp. NBRC 14428]